MAKIHGLTATHRGSIIPIHRYQSFQNRMEQRKAIRNTLLLLLMSRAFLRGSSGIAALAGSRV